MLEGPAAAAAAGAAPLPLPPLAQYELLGLLGEGASGTVHRARRRASGALVAVKVVPHQTLGQGSAPHRHAARERSVAAALRCGVAAAPLPPPRRPRPPPPLPPRRRTAERQ